MALSGSFSGSIVSGHYKVRIDWTATQNIANNTSKITCKMYLINDWSLSINGRSDHTITIDGTTYKISSDAIRSTGTHYIGTCSKTVNHSSDGSKKVSLATAFQIEATISGTYYDTISASTTVTLDTIPRASSFTVSSISADMGKSVTFNISRASSAFTHKLTLTWGGKTSNIATNVGTSTEWTIPLSLANDLPNSTSSGCIITCITYNGSTEIGRKTLSMTIKVPSSVVPSISNITVEEATSGLASKFGAFVQFASALKVTISASGSYSSTIKRYSTKIGTATFSGNTFTTDKIKDGGSLSIVVTVTDSRGRTKTSTKNITILEYSPPMIDKFTAKRCNADGTLNDGGKYVKLEYAFNISSLNNKNDKSFTIAYKLKEDNAYTTLTSGNEYTLDTTYVSSVIFEVENSYDLLLTVKDYFKTISYGTDVLTEFSLVDYHYSGKGLAFGKVAEYEDLIDAGIPIRARQGITIDGAWINLEVDDAFTVYNGNAMYTPKYKVVGNVVTVIGCVSPKVAYTSSAELVTIARSIPAAYRPIAPAYFVCQGSSMRRWTCAVNYSTGEIQMARYGIADYENVPTSAWLMFCVTYVI